MANVAALLETAVTPLSPLWSIGVEEQFYAIWPVIIKISSNVVKALWIVIACYMAVKVAAALIGYMQLNALVDETRIDCMAIGGFGAVILRKRGRLLQFMYMLPVQLFCWGKPRTPNQRHQSFRWTLRQDNST